MQIAIFATMELVAVAPVFAAPMLEPRNDGQVMLSNADAQDDLAEYADCVVSHKRDRAKVVAFLRVAPDSPQFRSAAIEAADMTCLNGVASRRQARLQLKMQPANYRLALYPALYRRDFGKAGVLAIASLPPLDPKTEFDDLAAVPETYFSARKLGDCVSRIAPSGAHAMLVAQPYSAEENAAIEQVKPALSQCIPAGSTIHLNRDVVRGAVGEAMYKLASAARSGSANASPIEKK